MKTTKKKLKNTEEKWGGGVNGKYKRWAEMQGIITEWRHNWKKREEKSHNKNSDGNNGHKRQEKEILDTYNWVLGEKHKEWKKTQTFKDAIQGNSLIIKCDSTNWKNCVYQGILTQLIMTRNLTRNILVRLNSKNEGRILLAVKGWSTMT